jgi:hypothetical protein
LLQEGSAVCNPGQRVNGGLPVDLVLCLFLARDIAKDLEKSDQLTAVVADGGEDTVGPETAAVLAHVPAVIGGSPLLRRDFPLVRRDSPGIILRRKEDVTAAIYNLISRESKDAR